MVVEMIPIKKYYFRIYFEIEIRGEIKKEKIKI